MGGGPAHPELERFIAGFRASFNRMYAEGHEEPPVEDDAP